MLDTNILISIVIFNSSRLKEMLIKICEKYTLVLSSYNIEEFKEVINKKFPNKRKNIDEFLSKLPYILNITPISNNMNISNKYKI